MSRIHLIAFLMMYFPFSLFSQEKFWLPDTITIQDNLPFYCSGWLKECSYQLTEEQRVAITTRGISTSPVLNFEPASFDWDKDLLGFALEQLQGEKLIERGLTGKGIKIGIIDGGFLAANTSPALHHLFEDSLVVAYRDLITPDLPPYEGMAALDDVHGTEVWQLIGGKNPEKEIQYGLATGASYYLARTDHGGFEKRIEEDKLIEALEWMHGEGVQLVNISLGYAKDFTNPRENYTPAQMDGKFSAVARAVDTAFYKKNMLIVVAAGNEATDPKWRVLSTPGDAKGALTVGATKLSIWERMDYSSFGTPGLPYVKPDIACFAGDGTSFATPVITGLAALLMELYPEKNAAEIRELIEQSGHHYPYPNDHVGNGVPLTDRLLLPEQKTRAVSVIKTTKSRVKLNTSIEKNYITILHKVNHFHVVKRQVIRPKKLPVKVKRHEKCTQSSVMIDNRVWEIFWE